MSEPRSVEPPSSKTAFYDDRFTKLTKPQLLEILRLKGSNYENRLSDLLIEQLRLGCVNNYVHPEKIINEIDILESVSKSKSRTKAEGPFVRGILNEKGLWKKHFFQFRFFGKNVMNEFQLNRKKSEVFKRLVLSIASKTTTIEEFSSVLANTVVNKTIQGELTGEWIVFKKFQGNNYYLTLASHKEDDVLLYQRILTGCQNQFPFLF